MGASISNDELTSIAEAVRRLARTKGVDRAAVDDVVQESVARLLTAADRLEPGRRLPYTLTTASNLLVNTQREADRARRHAHLLVPTQSDEPPETHVIAAEQAAAVRAALDRLDPDERDMLVEHAAGSTTIVIADSAESTPGAVAARLARTRARLRLDYLLALRRVELPTAQCRRILLAISAGDRRRQLALEADEHVASCATCAGMVAPLRHRRSALASIMAAPLVALGGWGGKLRLAAKSHRVQVSAGVGAAGVAAGVYIASVHSPPHPALPPRPAAAPSPVHTARGVSLLPVPPAQRLRTFVGQQIVVSHVDVQSVVSHPGFWLGGATGRFYYVHLDHADQMRHAIAPGRRVSFTGRMVANNPGFAVKDGVTTDEGASLLSTQGVHLEVDGLTVKQD